jgi:hypothetical protein
LRVFDIVLRVVGGALAVLLSVGAAVLEILATQMFWLIPVSAALLGNLLLYWFAQETVRWRWAWLLPATPWLALFLVAVSTTRDGDQLADPWIGLATFAAGALGFFVPAALRRHTRLTG